MGKPVLIAVTDDLAVLAALKDQLPRRYDRDYDIAAADSGVAGIAHLDELRLAGRQVAIVLAYQWLPDMTGIDFLSRRVKNYEHNPQYGLLIDQLWVR